MSRGIALICLFLASGCALHPRAQNPLPGVFRVAVVPFGDKTGGSEGLDTYHMTELFASELQRIPTYEVVPVEEVREVLGHQCVETNQPELAFALARALHAQAIIVGDVFEYDPYYPPRVGLHCQMYAMVTGEPELVVMNYASPREQVPDSIPPFLRTLLAPLYAHKKKDKHCHDKKKKCAVAGVKDATGANPKEATTRAPEKPVDQLDNGVKLTPIDDKGAPPKAASDSGGGDGIRQASYAPDEELKAEDYSPGRLPAAGIDAGDANAEVPAVAIGVEDERIERQRIANQIALQAGQVPDYRFSAIRLENPQPIIEPWVIRHSRVFLGENLGLARKLNHYHFFNKDERGGDWFAYTDRMDDFNRFCCNQMIYEMLVAAGGKWETLKGVYIPKPWEPWPWR